VTNTTIPNSSLVNEGGPMSFAPDKGNLMQQVNSGEGGDAVSFGGQGALPT